MSQPCGCCEGIQIVTPESEANRPGLSAIAYRVGTHATFLESMLARLSSLYIDLREAGLSWAIPNVKGAGYVAGDIVTVSGGTGGTLKVLTASVSGGVLSLKVLTPGTGYSAETGVATFGGSGSGLTVNTAARIYPLNDLTTRDPVDFSIALLDAWATVAGVLTFYQERIANEGYLPTATERRSILELARLVGYKLRPGVSASVYVAFTVANGFKGTIPIGTRAQSIPGTDELPQFFETSYDLAARDVWNNLKPRVTRPQVITLASNPSTKQPATIDQGTDATTRDTLYFRGMSTNLKTGDELLIVAGNSQGQQALRFVQSVDVQADQNRTEVTLQESALTLQTEGQDSAAQKAVANLQSVLNPFIADASNIFPGSVLASQVAGVLQGLVSGAQTFVQNNPTTASATAVAGMVQALIPQIQTKHNVATKRQFTRLEAWLAHILDVLAWLVQQLPILDPKSTGGGAGGTTIAGKVVHAPSSLANLFAIFDQLALPPKLQPANTFHLGRSVEQTFSPEADTAPRLLGTLKPAVADTLYKAWAGIAMPPSEVEVQAFRAKAALFASTYGGPATVPSYGGTVSFSNPPTIANAWTGLVPLSGSKNPTGPPTAVALDATYDQIKPGSWVAIDRPDAVDANKNKVAGGVTYHRVQAAQTRSMDTTTGFAAKVTLLTLNPPWLNELLTSPKDLETVLGSTPVLRGTVLYAQAEPLDLAEEPLDRDVRGNTIELDGLYGGLESGRWIIVSGDRTDITDPSGTTTATGVPGNELVMIAAVTQGQGKQSCFPITLNTVPFVSVYYITTPNDAGDMLVVARPNPGGPPIQDLLRAIPPPNVPGGNQQICDPVELAPGLYANGYIPTAAERAGDFSVFAASFQDPSPGSQYPIIGGIIPPQRFGDVFAWRITSIASGQDTPHTTLVLANCLAYTYDSGTVTIYGNVAKATHGQTVGEVLGNGDGSQALQKFALHQAPLTYVSAPTPAGAQSTLVVQVNDVEWHEADNLAALGPRDRGYITATDDADKTSVIFGNGEHGARLPTGTANVKGVYRYGIGKPGNVKAEQISQLATRPLGAKGVINPLPATGGADRDSRDRARGNAPLAVEALDRLVSVKDYADFARTFAGIGKASSARLSDGRRLVIYVTIAGADDIPIDRNSDLFQNLVQALHQSGDPYQPIQVEVRKLELLVISAGVKVLPDYQWESVEPKVRAVLLAKFGFDQRALGQSAFLSEAVSVLQGVEGVSYVKIQTFDAVPEDVTAEQLASLTDPNSILRLQLRDFVEADLARVDQAVTDPTKRIVPAELAILTPDIPDTLILTQITT